MYIDGHLDIAYNVLSADRDFVAGAMAMREREAGKAEMGLCTAGLPELLRGGIGITFATLFTLPKVNTSIALPDKESYSTPEEAHSSALRQLAVYQAMVERDDVQFVRTQAELATLKSAWANGTPVLGLTPLMENGDPIRTPEEVAWWYEQGVRLLGPAWQRTRYCGGTRAPGPLTELGRALMREMNQTKMILDISHLAEASFWEAIELFHGTVVATHSNSRVILGDDPSERHLTDPMIKALIERDGVIGSVLFNAFLQGGYTREQSKSSVTLDVVVKHIDHICQMAGNTRHVAIGSDFDGGFGSEHIPAEIDTAADFAQIGGALKRHGYSDADVAAVLGGNWMRILEENLP